MNAVRKFITMCLVALIILSVCTITTGCSANASESSKPTTSRFVEVDEALICADYKLGTDNYLSDGSKEHDINNYRYLVDRVSKRVYIEIRETGQHSSGIVWIECLDKDGNHMVYTGELEGK